MNEKDLWPDRRWRRPLPVDSRLEELDSLLAKNQVVVFQADTGAGKTIRIGQYFTLKHPIWHVWLTQTHRPAVRSNGKRIAYEMGEQPGETIGWRLRGEPRVGSRNTRLELVIDQTLVNMIRRLGYLPKGLLIIDEAHERQISTDLLLWLIREYLPSSSETKVIITSATIDTEKFSAYFGGAPIVEAKGRTYPVEVRVKEMPYADHHSTTAISAALEVMEAFAKGEVTIIHPDDAEAVESGQLSAESARRQTVETGAVAILLPGKEDIKNAVEALKRHAQFLGISDRIEILASHAEANPSEQDRVFEPVSEGILRFIAATEIIRSSVTPADLVGLVDSLQVKRPISDAKGVAHLMKIAISKAEAYQGMGRSGRTQPGFYIPVSYDREYYNLKLWPEPAILQQPVTSVVLQIAAAGFNIRTAQLIDNPAIENVEVAITRLIKLGALDQNEKITELGRLIVQFPLDPERARVLITADRLGVLAEAIIAVSVLEAENIRFKPREGGEKVILPERFVRDILARTVSSRYFGEGDEREWRKPRPEEIDLENDLPNWIVLREDGLFEVDCSNYHFPHREGAKWVADLVWAEFAGESESDFVAVVNAYRAFKAAEYAIRDEAEKLREDSRKNGGNGEEANGKSYPGSRRWQDDQLFGWCQRNFLNYKRLRMVEFLIGQIREEVASSPLRLENGINQEREFSSDALTKALASGLVDNVCRRDSGYLKGPLGDELQIGYGSAAKESASGLIFIGGAHKIPVRRRRSTGFIYLVDMAAPIQAEWLAEVMPQLCEPRLRANSAVYNPKTGQVDGIEDVYYGNVVIKSYPVQVKGELAAKVIADAMIATKTGLPAEWLAKFFRNEVYELTTREGKQREIQTEVRDWLVNRLGTAGTRDEAAKCDLLLTDEIVSEILGFDYPKFRERIYRERPDFWQIGNQLFRLEYSSNWGTRPVKVVIKVPRLLARRLTADQLPSWENTEVRVYVDSKDYSNVYISTDHVDQLAEKVETRRLELAWQTFRAYGHGDYDRKVEVAYEEPLPGLPEPEVWDRVTKSEAYPAWVIGYTYSGENAHTDWYLRWFRTEDEALQAREAAEAKKREVDAKEYERRNYEVLTQQAQTLFLEVSSLWLEVDVDKYQAYGLSQDEANKGYWSSSTSINSKLETARGLAGLGSHSYNLAPTKALETLNELKVRIEQAIAYFAENETRRPAAEEALESARNLYTQVYEAYSSTDAISYDELNFVEKAKDEAESAFESGDYIKAIEEADKVSELAQPILAKVEAQLAAKKAFEAWLAAVYTKCPVCGEEFEGYDGATHWCAGNYQDALVGFGQGQDFPVKVSRTIDGTEVARIEARYQSRYNEYELRFSILDRPVPFDPKLTTTEEPWQPPDEHTLAIRAAQAKLAELEQTLIGVGMSLEYELEEYRQAEEAALERLMANYATRPIVAGDVFEVTFHEEERQGQRQLTTDPFFDEPSGSWNKLVEDPYHSLKPLADAKQLVRVRAKSGAQLHLFAYRTNNPEGEYGRGGRSVTVYGYFAQPVYGEVHHKARVEELKAQIAEVQAEIARLEAEPAPKKSKPKKGKGQTELVEEAFDNEENPETSMAAALRKAMERTRRR